MKRNCHGLVSMLSTETQIGVWYGREGKAISTWWLGTEESCGYCKKPSMGKVGAQLGGAISY